MLASASAKLALPPVRAGTQAAVLARNTTTPDPGSLLDRTRPEQGGVLRLQWSILKR